MGEVEYEHRFAIRYALDADSYRGRWWMPDAWERGDWWERKTFARRSDAMAQLWKLRADGKTVKIVRIKRRKDADG